MPGRLRQSASRFINQLDGSGPIALQTGTRSELTKVWVGRIA